jgi:hypothetical protein
MLHEVVNKYFLLPAFYLQEGINQGYKTTALMPIDSFLPFNGMEPRCVAFTLMRELYK